MKYSDLISFNPIEDVIQLTTADDANRAKEYVKSYVMSDTMAANLKSPVLDQLQMDEVVDNKGVLVVGNYGTGKSHLMSVISSIAKDTDNLQYLQNKNFAKEMECIAGKFEVLRIEIGGVTMSLREILFGFIEDDFAARGIDFEVPDFDTVRDNKKLIRDMMMAFSAMYPDKGYLIVVDEFLSYLTSRDERQIVLDLEFFRALGEMCSKSKLRVIFGVQEKIFDNPRFSFVSDTLKHVSDRFTQIVITKEATSYVVSERILKKTPEQKALIRKHLEKFSMLYTGMSSRMDEFVDLFPIHPSYIDVFNKIYLIENRHILKNISMTIRDIFNRDVPENEPGIISFDNYWPAIKSNGLLKSDVTINRVVTASGQLEDKFSEQAGSEETAWFFVGQYLDNLPVVSVENNKIQMIAERQAYLLFDRMVAYHIMRGIPVPLDATDFYRGLDEKFLKRDNMYFLPDQVNEYDTARITTEVENIQFALFVTNEKSAISWLYQQLDPQFCGPQTYAELQPKFMQEVKAVDKYEQMPELATILEENFLQDENGRWYIPDVTKEGDLVKLREKNLWKEFESYMNSKGKLKLFRSEAIRVGFSRLWKEKNYKAIVDIAERLPEQTIQEDSNLLMYYDISLGRV